MKMPALKCPEPQRVELVETVRRSASTPPTRGERQVYVVDVQDMIA